MADAAESGDVETLRQRAHSLSGSSRQMGFARLGRLCRRIETGDGDARRLVGEAREAFEQALASADTLV